MIVSARSLPHHLTRNQRDASSIGDRDSTTIRNQVGRPKAGWSSSLPASFDPGRRPHGSIVDRSAHRTGPGLPTQAVRGRNRQAGAGTGKRCQESWFSRTSARQLVRVWVSGWPHRKMGHPIPRPVTQLASVYGSSIFFHLRQDIAVISSAYPSGSRPMPRQCRVQQVTHSER